MAALFTYRCGAVLYASRHRDDNNQDLNSQMQSKQIIGYVTSIASGALAIAILGLVAAKRKELALSGNSLRETLANFDRGHTMLTRLLWNMTGIVTS